MGTYSDKAIVFGNIKEALLYFNSIVPISDEMHDESIINPLCGILNQRIDDRFWRNYEDALDVYAALNLLPDPFNKSKLARFSMVNTLSRLYNLEWHPDFNFLHLEENKKWEMQETIRAFIFDYGLENIPLVMPPPQFGMDTELNPVVALTEMNLVNVDSVGVEQIVAFRSDVHSANKMRRLRLFVYDNYNGKERNYIEDDIQQRLAAYNEVVKSWGFETKVQTLSFVLNSKYLSTMLGASFLSAMFGSTAEAIGAAATGVGIEIGRYTLELSKQKHELRKIIRDNPISYIADAKEKLEDQHPHA